MLAGFIFCHVMVLAQVSKNCRLAKSHFPHSLKICSCLTYVYRVMDAHGKFGEHEKWVRVARGAAESNSSFLSALQTS